MNQGDVVLNDVVVTDTESPACTRTSSTIAGLASMAPGASVMYVCTLANVAGSFTNFATATGTPPSGPEVSATDSALVIAQQRFTPPDLTVTHAAVGHPSISIVKDPKSQSIGNGGTARFTITVKNTGNMALSNVTVSDPLSSGCDNSLGTLASNETRSYSCTRADVTADFTNTAEASGTPPTGPAVSDNASADVSTGPFTPPVPKRKKAVTTAAKVIVKPNKVHAKPKAIRVKAKPVVVSHVVPRTTG
jgi:uncharacterized repeat protein (TIGR01451 family)